MLLTRVCTSVHAREAALTLDERVGQELVVFKPDAQSTLSALQENLGLSNTQVLSVMKRGERSLEKEIIQLAEKTSGQSILRAVSASFAEFGGLRQVSVDLRALPVPESFTKGTRLVARLYSQMLACAYLTLKPTRTRISSTHTTYFVEANKNLLTSYNKFIQSVVSVAEDFGWISSHTQGQWAKKEIAQALRNEITQVVRDWIGQIVSTARGRQQQWDGLRDLYEQKNALHRADVFTPSNTRFPQTQYIVGEYKRRILDAHKQSNKLIEDFVEPFSLRLDFAKSLELMRKRLETEKKEKVAIIRYGMQNLPEAQAFTQWDTAVSNYLQQQQQLLPKRTEKKHKIIEFIKVPV